jgi:hypothetical protein
MKIFNNGSYGEATVFASPGMDDQTNPDWVKLNLDGHKTAVMFTVKFSSGMATVDDALGRYMIEKGYAHKSPVKVPANFSSSENAEVHALKQDNQRLINRIKAAGISLG